MAGRTIAVPADSAPAGYFFLGTRLVKDGVACVEIPDYSPNDADRQWISRNLGDVPHTTMAERLAANGFPALAALSGMFDYAGETVRMRD